MADATIGVLQATSPDRLLDAEYVAALTAYRERNRLAGLAAAELADVRNAAPGSSDYGLIVRQVGVAAAAALADATANPTTISVGGFNFVWNGTTWDRWQGKVQPASNPTYGACSNGVVASGTAGATTLSLGYLFHPSAVTTLKYKLAKFRVSWAGGQGGDPVLLKLARITAENGTPGGTLQTNQAHNGDSAASSAIFRTGATGAPTRGTILDCIAITVDFPGQYEFDLTSYLNGQSYEMRTSTAEGWEAHIVTGTTGPTTAASFAVSAAWAEQAV
jgi:hypothetical protein